MSSLRLALVALFVLPPLVAACGDIAVQQSENPVCDGVQQPRESRVDEPFDVDGDGWFDANNPHCVETYDMLDCDDRNAEVHPGREEVACNGLDDDCDPATADSRDADGDGVDSCDDCDDTNPDVIGPDEDADADGWGICGGDCDDGEPSVHPGADEGCDGLDTDCDGAIPDEEADADGDGQAVCAGDCDDDDPDRATGLEEVCDGLDNDCDGEVPEDELDQDLDGVSPCEGDCNDQVWGGTLGSCDCPVPGGWESCTAAQADGQTIDGWYELLMPGEVAPEAHLCLMGMSGGGWTLALTSSDDGVDTFTFDDRELMTTDATPVGDSCAPAFDYRGAAWFGVPLNDLLFVHRPSGIWASYEDVWDGTLSPADFLAAQPFPACLSAGLVGYPMTAGSLTVGGALCDTDLYFNPGDHEAGEFACSDPDGPLTQHAFGPAWSAGGADGCPFDDPGASGGIGPLKSADGHAFEYDARGFGAALELNTGLVGLGENRLEVYVR